MGGPHAAILRLTVVSENRDISTLCQKVLAELKRTDWTIQLISPGESLVHSDLYIWDFHPGMTIADDIVQARADRHFFLVHGKAMTEFRQALGRQDARVLLKPVTHTTLRAFLCHAMTVIDSRRTQEGPNVDTLRRNVDDILQCLIEANLKLQEYDQERTNFLARAVHDFRAPLTAVSGYCGLLLSHQLGSLTDEQRGVLQSIEYSAQRLSRMANTMFHLSMGRLVQSQPTLRPHDIGASIKSAVTELKPLIQSKHISISVNITPPVIPLHFEQPQIEQVLINLIDNACRFTPRGGSIRIEGYPYFWDRRSKVRCDWDRRDRRNKEEQIPNAFRADIEDVGPGIPPSDLERIFEEFTSYSGGKDRSGGGLGLAICRLIMSQHHGDIWAENLKETGARFSFVIPFLKEKKAIQTENERTEPALCNGRH